MPHHAWPGAQVVKEVVNPNATIVYKENTADDPTRRKPDITKARVPYHPLDSSPPAVGLCMPQCSQHPCAGENTVFHPHIAPASELPCNKWVQTCAALACAPSPGLQEGMSGKPAVSGAWQAKKQLGWEPKVALREGLSRMVSDFAKRLDVPVPDIPGRPA